MEDKYELLFYRWYYYSFYYFNNNCESYLMKINDNTNIGLPLRNLIGLIGAVVIGAWFAFGVIERLNLLETKNNYLKKIY